MADIAQIIGFALVATALLVFIRQLRPEFALILNLVASAAILLFLMPNIVTAVGYLQQLAYRAEIETGYVGTLLRVVGIAYMAEFGAQICRDANETAIASKVEMAGKILILLLSLPIIFAVVELILKMMGS